MKNKEQNFTQAGIVLLLSSIVVKLIGALFKIPLSSDLCLGDLGFGYFSAVYDLYTPIYTLALSGFPVAIARLVADFTAKGEIQGVKSIYLLSRKALLLLGVIGSFVFVGISLPLMLSKGSDNTFYSLLAVAPSVIFCCASSVYRGYFEGVKNMYPTAVSNIIEALGKLVLGLSGAVITMKFTRDPAMASAAALLGITIGTVASCIYLKIKFKKSSNITDSAVKVYDKKMLGSLLAILIPVAIASFSVGVTGLIDSITLRPQLSKILSDNPDNARLLLNGTVYNGIDLSKIPMLIYGIRGKAHTLFGLVPTLTTAFGIGAVPLVAQCFVKGDSNGLAKNINLCLKFSSLLSLPLAVGFMSVGEGIIRLLYGKNSAVLGGKILFLYGIAALFAGLSVPTTALLQGISKQKAALKNIAFGIFLKVICNLVLTASPKINVFGTVIATAMCFIVIFILNMVALISATRLLPNIINCFLKPLIAAVFCGVTAFFVYKITPSSLGLIISIAAAGLVYFAFLLIFAVITKEDIKEFTNFRQ